jgi:hypothetical protein
MTTAEQLQPKDRSESRVGRLVGPLLLLFGVDFAASLEPCDGAARSHRSNAGEIHYSARADASCG